MPRAPALSNTVLLTRVGAGAKVWRAVIGRNVSRRAGKVLVRYRWQGPPGSIDNGGLGRSQWEHIQDRSIGERNHLMNQTARKCFRCDAAMQIGFVVDNTSSGSIQAQWTEKDADPSAPGAARGLGQVSIHMRNATRNGWALDERKIMGFYTPNRGYDPTTLKRHSR